MVRYSNEQLLHMIAQLDQALEKHEQWHNGIIRTFIAHIPPDAHDLSPDAHRHCAFGQWFESAQVRMTGDHPSLVALGEAHQLMHRTATKLLQHVAENHPISAQEIDEFTTVRDRMKLQLQSWRQELVDTLQNSDPLTGARNRLTMLSYLRLQHSLVQRRAQQCAIAFIDVDYFKDVNDRYGHQVGDAVLAYTVQTIESMIRSYDRIYRYGGEEFLLCMPNVSIEDAVHLAKRLRKAIAVNDIETDDGQEFRVTASFGIAAFHANKTVEESIDQADRALYLAKTRGRNRVEVAD
jgi:diguanylate cyclase